MSDDQLAALVDMLRWCRDHVDQLDEDEIRALSGPLRRIDALIEGHRRRARINPN